MLTASPVGNKFFFQLGKLLATKKPEIAQQLISEYLPAVKPAIEADLSKIPLYFKLFCEHQHINPEEYTGPLYKSSKIDQRRYFIAVVINLYSARAQKLAIIISETIGQDVSATRRMINDQEFRYQKIEDYKNEIDQLTKEIYEKTTNYAGR